MTFAQIHTFALTQFAQYAQDFEYHRQLQVGECAVQLYSITGDHFL